MAAEPLDDLTDVLYPTESSDWGGMDQEAEDSQYAGDSGPVKLGGPATPYDALIYKMATARGQDPNLIKAQIAIESGFNPKAVSPKKARGLSQFMPATFAQYGRGDPHNPENAIEAQLNYNEHLGKMFRGDVPLMLAAYNAGEGAVQKHGGIPPYQETQKYVKDILDRYAEYTGGATPQGAAGQQIADQTAAQAYPEGSYEIEFPDGGILTVYGDMPQQQAIMEAAKENPDLAKYIHGAAAPATQTAATPGVTGALRDAAGNLVGGAKELGSSLLKSYAETGLPKAETAEAYSKAMEAEAEKEIKHIPKEEIDAAYKQSFASGLLKEAQSVGMYEIPHMIGRYGASMIPAGRAMTAGKYLLEGAASFGDIQKRAEKEGKGVEGWKAGAAAAVSSMLANSGLPHVVSQSVFGRVLGESSMKALSKAFEEGGVEAANKLLGSKVIDVVSGLGTAGLAGFGVMAGTEAAQRAALGEKMQSPEELLQTARTAAWMSPLALPGALKAKGAREEYVDYLQEQKDIQEAAGQIQQEEAAPVKEKKVKPEAMPDKELSGLTVEQADMVRAAQAEAAAPPQEKVTPEPVKSSYTVDTEAGAFPVELTRTPDGNVVIDSGEGPFEYSEKQVAGKTDADILAQHFDEAGFKSATAAGEAPPSVKTEPTVEAPPEVEVPPEAPSPEVPKAEAPPVAEPHFAESILGLKPVKDKRSLYQKLLKHDINTPEGREAITDLMHKTSARIEPEKAAALQKRLEELDAQQITEAGAPDGGRGPQPSIREEGRDQAISGEGVEPSRQGIETPEVGGEKVQVPEEKVDEFVSRIAEMQKEKKAPRKKQLRQFELEEEPSELSYTGLEDVGEFQGLRDYEAPEDLGGYDELRFESKAPPEIENPHTVESVQADLKSRYGRNAPRVEVSTREAEGVDASVRGFHDPQTGRTVLIADNIGKGEDLHGLLKHEVGVHAQRLGRTDPEFQDILRRVDDLEKQGAKDVLEAAARVPEGTKPEHRSEEILGYLTQHAPNLPVVQRFKSWLRRIAHKLTGSTRWLTGNEFSAMADQVLRKPPKEAPRREGEQMFAKRKTKHDKYFEERDLVKVAPSATKEMLNQSVDAVSKAIDLAIHSEARSAAHADIAARGVAQSAALAKHVAPLETFDPARGVRSDILRNQFDSLGHLLKNALMMGTPGISKGGLMKISKNERLAMFNWYSKINSLPVSAKTAMSVLRVLRGEHLEKESAAMRKKATDYKQYADTLKKSAEKLKGAERDKRLRMAKSLATEANKLLKIAGEEAFTGKEKKVNAKDIVEAHQAMQIPEVKDWVNQAHEINRKAVDFLVDTGVLDKETARIWKDNPYVALFKSWEDLKQRESMGDFGWAGSAKTLKERKKLKGSEQTVNIAENMLRSWNELYTTGYKNHVRRRTVEDMRILGKTERTSQKDPLAVMVKKNGKEEYWHVPDKATAEAMEMTPFIHGAMANLLAEPAAFASSALIKHPVFWARSITREPITANFTSRTGFIAPHQVVGHLLKSLVGASKPKETLGLYGTAGVHESQLDPTKFSRAITGSSGYEKILDFWNSVHSSFDTATRSAIYDAAAKEGKKYGLKGEMLEDFAAMKATEFANFATRGSSRLVNEWGRMTPFMKSSLNSLDNLYRNATGTHLNFRERQQAREMFRARAAGMAYLTAVYALAMLNDPDYRNAADSDWTMNYFIPSGRKEGKWIPIAAGFEPAVLFKMLPELLVRTYTGNLEPAEAAGIAADVARERLLPPMVPLLPDMIGRIVFDYDVNLGRSIESVGAQRLPPEARDFNASVIGQMLSEKFNEGGLGVSPAKLDNLGKGMLGGIYDMAITLADLYIAEANPELLFDKTTPQKYPLTKFAYTNTNNVQKAPVFYEASNTFEKVVNAVKKSSAEGDKKTLDKIVTDPELMKQYEYAKPLRQYRDDISQIRKAIANLRFQDIPIAEKEAKAKELTALRQRYETEGALLGQKVLREIREKEAAKSEE